MDRVLQIYSAMCRSTLVMRWLTELMCWLTLLVLSGVKQPLTVNTTLSHNICRVMNRFTHSLFGRDVPFVFTFRREPSSEYFIMVLAAPYVFTFDMCRALNVLLRDWQRLTCLLSDVLVTVDLCRSEELHLPALCRWQIINLFGLSPNATPLGKTYELWQLVE